MTKEVEVGDEFAGKVVKTTTFGAFVELSKGTDGLLHISNVSPGQRVDTVEDVLNRATRSTCAWSRSTASAAASACAWPTTRTIAGKSVEELAAVGAGGGGGGGRARGRDGGDRGGRDRDGGGRDRGRAARGRPRRDRDPDRD